MARPSRSRPGAPWTISPTTSLYQAHAPWLTAVLVTLNMTGRDERWKPATLTTTVTVEQAGDLARVLTDLAASDTAWQTRQTEDYLSALQAKVQARSRAGTRSDHDDLTGGACAPNAGSYGPGGAA